jgi:hypothetical protein
VATVTAVSVMGRLESLSFRSMDWSLYSILDLAFDWIQTIVGNQPSFCWLKKNRGMNKILYRLKIRSAMVRFNGQGSRMFVKITGFCFILIVESG